jgi:hypothetical protein
MGFAHTDLHTRLIHTWASPHDGDSEHVIIIAN